MKIVQSFWSKPALKSFDENLFGRKFGGWPNKFYNYVSWAFSCLQFRKFYEKVELVTDEHGYDILIRKLKLPYTSHHVILDQLNTYHHDFWAMGKIKAYQIQKAPFIHADGDVFIWEKFSDHLENARLLAQGYETHFRYYDDFYEVHKNQLNFLPTEIVELKKNNSQLDGINAGIIGGWDIAFFQEYCSNAESLVLENLEVIDKTDRGLFNTFYEQCLFYAMAKNKNISTTYLIPYLIPEFDGLCNLSATPANLKYAHAVAMLKKKEEIGELLSHFLFSDYPQYYFRILSLLRTHQL